ncbi:MAG: phosphatidylglycerophosphatase A [Candidatus Binatia bacterium]|nr:phosphatidylglycerophosphatase A [Candidatus Binatia bacterium]
MGFAPFAPGTFGSLLGIPLYLAILQVTDAVVPTLVLVAVAIGIACWIAGQAEQVLPEHDSGEIVIDEIVGMLVALLWIPPTFPNLILAFALFRVFDIVKIWPAGEIDRRMPGGAGVVLDDVVSGIYANLLMRLFI